MRLFVLTVAWASLCSVALAAELNLTITSGGNAVVVVEPGEIVPYEVTGVLSDTDNEGLSFFIFDLAFDGGPLTPVAVPVAAPLANFSPPEGFTNPEGYGGTVVDGMVKQVGGSQNTLKAPFMDGPVVSGVGHSLVVLATGSLTVPMVPGLYVLSAREVLGRVIQQGDDGSGDTWNTEFVWEGTVESLAVQVGDCESIGDCSDIDGDGIRDDNCVWWACTSGICQATDIAFADMGGQFGACTPDGTADGNDRFHTLSCFANQNVDGSSPYDCEDRAPTAFNVDAGGPFGGCNPDGVCDGNDAFHALSAFEGTSSCSCAGGPMPEVKPVVVGEATLELRADKKQVRAGDVIEVDVFLATPLEDLRGYQLHLGVSGGTRGQLLLVDISIADRDDLLFAGKSTWDAYNVKTGQMVTGVDSAGMRVRPGAYLATFAYRVPREAVGDFRINLLHGSSDSEHRTFLFPEKASRLNTDSDGVLVRVVSGEGQSRRRDR